MVCPNDAQARQRLELLYQRSPAFSLRQLMADFVRQVGSAIIDELTRDRSEPHISKFYTVEGQVLWHVYDPTTRQRLTTTSELEVREWLEYRHLRN